MTKGRAPVRPVTAAPAPGPTETKIAQRAPRIRSHRTQVTFIRVASIIGGLALWEIVGRWVITNRLIFVPFSDVVRAGLRMTKSGTLGDAIVLTLKEVLIGLLLACFVGILLGLLIAASKLLGYALNPWIMALYSTPLVALTPLTIVWFGIGITSKIAIVFISALFPILLNTITGIKETKQGYIDVAKVFGLARSQTFYKVLLPHALSFIVTGIRLGVGRGIVGAVVGEFFGSRGGLGYLLLVAGQSFQTAELLCSVCVLALMGIVGTSMVQLLEDRLAPWKRQIEL